MFYSTGLWLRHQLCPIIAKTNGDMRTHITFDKVEE
jgi:hypothetical protein